MNCAYTTLISTNNYVWGAICCALSFKKTNSKYPFIFLISEEISKENIQLIKNTNLGLIKMIPSKIFEKNKKHIYKYSRQKFEVFNLIEYDRIFFADADTFFINNFDEELEKYPIIFDIRNRYNFNLNIICGEFFIITPNKDVYNHLDFISQNYKTDEECFFSLFGDNFIPPIEPNEQYSFLFIKAEHCGNVNSYKKIKEPKYPNQPKYWQQYDMNMKLAEDIINFLIKEKTGSIN